MDAYQALKLLHILSATVLFGTGLGTAFHMWAAHRRGDVPGIAAAARSTVAADWLFTAPAGVLQPLTGVLLAREAGFSLSEPWLLATYVLYTIALGCWLPVVAMQIRVRVIARQAEDAGTALPAHYHKLMRAWFWLGWPAFVSLIAVFWLMVVKPGA